MTTPSVGNNIQLEQLASSDPEARGKAARSLEVIGVTKLYLKALRGMLVANVIRPQIGNEVKYFLIGGSPEGEVGDKMLLSSDNTAHEENIRITAIRKIVEEEATQNNELYS